VHHVQGAADLRTEWFRGADTVGITAGTSTPDSVIDKVEQGIRTLSGKRREEFFANHSR
jgi:4-hydroxy-3-methylbut-2-enyl diphosphate reductase